MMNDDSVLLTAREAWELCKLSKPTWYRYKATGRLPRPVKVGGGRCYRWWRAELLAWLKSGCPVLEKWDAMNSGKC